MLVRSLMYKNHQDYTTNRRKSMTRNLNVPPAYLKKDNQIRGIKNSHQSRKYKVNSKNCWNVYLAKLLAATFQDRKKKIKVC